MTLALPELICFPNQEKFEEMAAYTENRCGLTVYFALLMDHTYPSWHHRSTTATILTIKAGTSSGCKWKGTCLEHVCRTALEDAGCVGFGIANFVAVGLSSHHFSAYTRIGGVNVGYCIIGHSAYPRTGS